MRAQSPWLATKRAQATKLALCSVLSSLVLAASWAAPRQEPASGPSDGQGSGSVGPAFSGDAITGHPRVVDGDSLKLNGLAIRMHGIDAPEMTQPCNAAPGVAGVGSGSRRASWLQRWLHRAGSDPQGLTPSPASSQSGAGTWSCGVEARRALSALIDGKPVACTPTTLDKYGRTVARCHVTTTAGATVDLGAEMVRLGMAWAFVRYSTDYVAIEGQARAARRGIWQAETQTAWDFRAAKWQAAEMTATQTATTQTIIGQRPGKPGEVVAVAPAGCAIKGNVTWKGERIYHLPWSPWYDRVRMDGNTLQRRGKRWFCSETEAIAAGWRASAAW